jgi:hypothetical protein
MEIVKFKNGKFGIRRESFLYGFKFLDLSLSRNVWRTTSYLWFELDCKNINYENVKSRFESFGDDGVPV